jgi:hypothetical protein
VSAASQLSQAELEELLAENAKLKQLLNSYAHKLSPEQVGGLGGECIGIAASLHVKGFAVMWKLLLVSYVNKLSPEQVGFARALRKMH